MRNEGTNRDIDDSRKIRFLDFDSMVDQHHSYLPRRRRIGGWMAECKGRVKELSREGSQERDDK